MANNDPPSESSATSWVLVWFAWLMVSIPLLWGIWQTLKKAAALFR